MFRKAKNIDETYRHIRLFTIVVVCGAIALCCFTLHKSFQAVKAAESRVYVLSSGKVLEAYASQRSENTAIEARDHIENFHRLFFSLDPDEKSIESTISKALYLADGSAKKQYDDLRESGYFTGIISGNISQQIQIDSVGLDTKVYPYTFSCKARQRIIRPTSIVIRKLLTQGSLRPVARSDHNPHGFLIEKWSVTENQDISMQSR